MNITNYTPNIKASHGPYKSFYTHHNIKISNNNKTNKKQNQQIQLYQIQPWINTNNNGKYYNGKNNIHLNININRMNNNMNDQQLLSHRSLLSVLNQERNSVNINNDKDNHNKKTKKNSFKFKNNFDANNAKNNEIIQQSMRFQQYQAQKALEINQKCNVIASSNNKNYVKQKQIDFIQKNKRDLLIFQQSITNPQLYNEQNKNNTLIIQHSIKKQLIKQNKQLQQSSRQLNKFVSMKKTDKNITQNNKKNSYSYTFNKHSANILNLSYLDKGDFKQSSKKKNRFLRISYNKQQTQNKNNGNNNSQYDQYQQNYTKLSNYTKNTQYRSVQNQRILYSQTVQSSPRLKQDFMNTCNPQQQHFQKILKLKNKQKTHFHTQLSKSNVKLSSITKIVIENTEKVQQNNNNENFLQQQQNLLKQQKNKSPIQLKLMISRIHSLKNKNKHKKNYLLQKSQKNIFKTKTNYDLNNYYSNKTVDHNFINLNFNTNTIVKHNQIKINMINQSKHPKYKGLQVKSATMYVKHSNYHESAINIKQKIKQSPQRNLNKIQIRPNSSIITTKNSKQQQFI